MIWKKHGRCRGSEDCYVLRCAGHPVSHTRPSVVCGTAHQDIADRKLSQTRVRVYGDDIAAVIAEDDIAAARAARLVKVEYEEYAPMLTVEDAMAEGASCASR